MSIDADDVRGIAHLARLGIDDEEVSRYAKELSRILEFVQQLDAADTDGVSPMAHLHGESRLRADQVTEENQRDAFLPLALAADSGMYLVPRVIE